MSLCVPRKSFSFCAFLLVMELEKPFIIFLEKRAHLLLTNREVGHLHLRPLLQTEMGPARGELPLQTVQFQQMASC